MCEKSRNMFSKNIPFDHGFVIYSEIYIILMSLNYIQKEQKCINTHNLETVFFVCYVCILEYCFRLFVLH